MSKHKASTKQPHRGTGHISDPHLHTPSIFFELKTLATGKLFVGKERVKWLQSWTVWIG